MRRLAAGGSGYRGVGFAVKRIHVQSVPREDDDRLLAMAAMRCRGFGWTAIAKRFGSRKGTVSKALNAMLADDIAHSGEPAGSVRSGYWA